MKNYRKIASVVLVIFILVFSQDLKSQNYTKLSNSELFGDDCEISFLQVQLDENTNYDTIRTIENRYGTIVYLRDQKRKVSLMVNDKLAFPSEYSIRTSISDTTNFVIAGIANMYGIYSLKEKAWITDLEFENLEVFFHKCRGSLEGKVGLLNNDGTIALAFEWEEIKYLNYKNSVLVKNASTSKWGVYAISEDRIIIPAEYDTLIFNSFNYCFVVKKDGKYNLLNTSNELKLDIWYDEINQPFYDSPHYLYQNEGVFGLLDASEFKQSSQLFTNVFSVGPRYIAAQNKYGKYGIIDYRGEVVFPFEYDQISCFDKGKMVQTERNGKLGLISFDFRTPKIILEPKAVSIEPHYSEKIIIQLPTGYGIIDKKGKSLVEPVFEKIYWEVQVGKEIFIANKDSKYHFINKKNWSVSAPFYEISAVNTWNDGYAIVKNESEQVLIFDYKYNNLLPQAFDHIELLYSDIYPVIRAGKYGIFDPNSSKLIIKNEYDKIISHDGLDFTLIRNKEYFKYKHVKKPNSIPIVERIETDNYTLTEKSKNSKLPKGFVFCTNKIGYRTFFGIMQGDKIIIPPIFDQIITTPDSNVMIIRAGKSYHHFDLTLREWEKTPVTSNFKVPYYRGYNFSKFMELTLFQTYEDLKIVVLQHWLSKKLFLYSAEQKDFIYEGELEEVVCNKNYEYCAIKEEDRANIIDRDGNLILDEWATEIISKDFKDFVFIKRDSFYQTSTWEGNVLDSAKIRSVTKYPYSFMVQNNDGFYGTPYYRYDSYFLYIRPLEFDTILPPAETLNGSDSYYINKKNGQYKVNNHQKFDNIKTLDGSVYPRMYIKNKKYSLQVPVSDNSDFRWYDDINIVRTDGDEDWLYIAEDNKRKYLAFERHILLSDYSDIQHIPITNINIKESYPCFIVKKNEDSSYAIVNMKGELISDFEFSEVERIDENFFIVSNSEKYGLHSKKKREIITPIIFDKIYKLKNEFYGSIDSRLFKIDTRKSSVQVLFPY